MNNIIHLLPDVVCNQIAAGEVIQRPGSVVKELLENSVDAQSTSISLVIEDNGESLIQVIDNGIGMSEVDLRMSLEKHATSKICTIEDLFNIKTMGFRGEAVASIAAVSQTEIITCLRNCDLGSKLIVEGSIVKSQVPVAAQPGTIFSVKNLFYNIPARRKFLKSPRVELKHIVDEFIYVALSHPDIEFKFITDGECVYDLKPTTFFDRIVDTLGDNYRDILLECNESNDFITIHGFFTNPLNTKRSRDGQYLFINERHVRNNYINRAIMTAYDRLIPSGEYPSYVLFITMDPSDLDVNIHPAKVEIGLHNGELVYSTVISAVKKLLLSFDSKTFDLNTANILSPECQNLDVKSNFINFTEKMVSNNPYPRQTTINFTKNSNSNVFIDFIRDSDKEHQSNVFINDYKKLQIVPYIIATTNTSDLLIVHQDRAQERIFFEQYMNKNCNNVPQQLLFPIDIQLSPGEYNIIHTNKSVMNSIGFNIDFKSQNIITICGHPSHLCEEDINETIYDIIEQLEFSSTIDLQKQIAVIMSKRFKHNMTFSDVEMDVIINQLFNYKENIYTVDGKKIWTIIAFENLFN